MSLKSPSQGPLSQNARHGIAGTHLSTYLPVNTQVMCDNLLICFPPTSPHGVSLLLDLLNLP